MDQTDDVVLGLRVSWEEKSFERLITSSWGWVGSILFFTRFRGGLDVCGSGRRSRDKKEREKKRKKTNERSKRKEKKMKERRREDDRRQKTRRGRRRRRRKKMDGTNEKSMKKLIIQIEPKQTNNIFIFFSFSFHFLPLCSFYSPFNFKF